LTRYAGVQGVPFGADTKFYNLLLTAAFPVAGCLAVLGWRDVQLRRSQAYALSCSAALAGFLGSVARPSVGDFMFSAPLALPLIALGVEQIVRRWDRRAVWMAAGLAALAAVPAAAYYGYEVLLIQSRPLIATPIGKVRFFRPEVADIVQAAASLPKQDGVFFYPYDPLLPVLTGHRQVGRVDVFMPGYTMPGQYAEACDTVEARASWVVRDRALSDPSSLRTLFPGIPRSQPPEAVSLEQCIRDHFAVKGRYLRFDLLVRRDDPKLQDQR